MSPTKTELNLMNHDPETYQLTCSYCHRVFEGKDKWNVMWAEADHEKYCALPSVHKVMKWLLLPLATVALIIFICVGVAFFALARLAYPFVYALELVVNNEVISWQSFNDLIYGGLYVTSHRRQSNCTEYLHSIKGGNCATNQKRT